MSKFLSALLAVGLIALAGATFRGQPSPTPPEEKIFLIEVFDQHHNLRSYHTGQLWQENGLVHVYDVHHDQEYVYHNYKVTAKRLLVTPDSDSSLAVGY
jgi:hypothetical protein